MGLGSFSLGKPGRTATLLATAKRRDPEGLRGTPSVTTRLACGWRCKDHGLMVPLNALLIIALTIHLGWVSMPQAPALRAGARGCSTWMQHALSKPCPTCDVGAVCTEL